MTCWTPHGTFAGPGGCTRDNGGPGWSTCSRNQDGHGAGAHWGVLWFPPALWGGCPKGGDGESGFPEVHLQESPGTGCEFPRDRSVYTTTYTCIGTYIDVLLYFSYIMPMSFKCSVYETTFSCACDQHMLTVVPYIEKFHIMKSSCSWSDMFALWAFHENLEL